jgi:predicted acylesterase/phospholipase RssA
MKVLILGGGGTLGAFSAGALKALEESGFVPDALIGSSAGGINLLRYLVGGADEAIRFWSDVAHLGTIVRGLVHGFNFSDGLLDAAWFRARVERGVDFEKTLLDTRTLGFMVVDMHTGKVSVRGNRTESDAHALRAVVHGSYALPPLLPPVTMKQELLADGGLLHNAPLNAAVKLGATEIIYLCNVQSLPFEGFRARSTLRASLRYAEIFFRRASNVGFVDESIVNDRFRNVPFLAIAPPAVRAFGSTLRWMIPRVDIARELVDSGFECASRALRARSFGASPR